MTKPVVDACVCCSPCVRYAIEDVNTAFQVVGRRLIKWLIVLFLLCTPVCFITMAAHIGHSSQHFTPKRVNVCIELKTLLCMQKIRASSTSDFSKAKGYFVIGNHNNWESVVPKGKTN